MVRHATLEIPASENRPPDVDAFLEAKQKWVHLRFGQNSQTTELHDELEQNGFTISDTVVCKKVVMGRESYDNV